MYVQLFVSCRVSWESRITTRREILISLLCNFFHNSVRQTVSNVFRKSTMYKKKLFSKRKV